MPDGAGARHRRLTDEIVRTTKGRSDTETVRVVSVLEDVHRDRSEERGGSRSNRRKRSDPLAPYAPIP